MAAEPYIIPPAGPALPLPSWASLVTRILLAVGLSVLAFLLVDCTHARPTPLTVSQQSMNSDMFERVKAEGSSACQSEGGLKGITWAYNTLPGGNRLDLYGRGGAVMYSDLPSGIQAMIRKRESPEQYDVGAKIADYAAAAPKAAQFVNDVGPSTATYICTDGAEKPSVNFLFVP